VIGFAGTKDRPIPMQQKDVDAILAQVRGGEDGKAKPKIEFGIGEVVKVSDVPSRTKAAWSPKSTRNVASCASASPSSARNDRDFLDPKSIG